MKDVFIFSGGAPDKVLYGSEMYKSQSDLYNFHLVDNAVLGNGGFEQIMNSEGIKLFTSEDQYELLSHMEPNLSLNESFDKYNIIAPRLLDPMDKSNLVGLDCAVPSVIITLDEAKFCDFRTPKILKPIKGSGCRGILIVYHFTDDGNKIRDLKIPNVSVMTDEDFKFTCDETKEHYVIQDFNMSFKETKQINVDFSVCNGELCDYVIHEKHGNELFSRWVTGYIDHSEKLDKMVRQALHEIIDKLGIEEGLLNFEAFRFEDKIQVFEVNCRYSSTMAIPRGISKGKVDLLLQILEIYETKSYKGFKFKDLFYNSRFEYKIGEVYYVSDRDLRFYHTV